MCSALANQSLSLKQAILAGSGVSVEALIDGDRKAFDAKLNARFAEELDRLGKKLDPQTARTLGGARVDFREHRNRTLNETVKALLEASGGRKLTKARNDKIDAALAGPRESKETLADLLDLDAPLDAHPLLKDALSAFRVAEIGRIAGLGARKVAALEKEGLDVERLNSAQIDSLAGRNVITAAEGIELRFLGAISRISGSNLALVEALQGAGPQSVADFVTWEQDDWQKLIDDNAIAVPDGEEDSASYAESLRRAIELSYPNEYLTARIAKPTFSSEIKLVEEIAARKRPGQPLLDGLSINKNAIDWRGLGGAAKKALESKLPEFGRFVKKYHDLGVPDLVNDDTLSPGERSARINRRLDGLKIFFANNPGLDLYVADFVDKRVKFDWSNIDREDQPHVQKQVRALQRVMTLTDDATKSMTLLETGFSSSSEIAAVSEESFLAESGFDSFDGRALYARAYENVVAVSHLFEEIREASFGVFDKLRPSNAPDLVNDLREIDGYETLFGDQNYCGCDHCRSLLSPSAYFVDLMRFIEEHVSEQVFVPSQTNHPLYLKRRRPDLWTLDLSCQSAKTELPYLQIVNEVLSAFVESELAVADVTATLATAQNSVILPINLLLEELRLHLEDFEISLAEIYRLLDRDESEWRREYLKLSTEELALLTTPDPGGVRARFGNLALNAMDLQDFMKFAGLTRDEVTALLSVRSLPEIAKVAVQVIQKPGDIQLYAERLKNLTNARLDLVHRFLRLARKIGYSIVETDLLLEALQAAGLLSTLESTDAGGQPALLVIAPLMEIAEALSLRPEEVAAMVGPLPDRALEEGGRSLYDRLFDRERLFGIAGIGAHGAPIYNPTATLPADRTQDKISALLAGSLGVSEIELAELLTFLGEDVTADIQVDTDLIARLFRHARLARGLGIGIGDLIGSITLRLGGVPVSSVDDFRAVVGFARWLEAGPFTVDALRLILTGTEGPGVKFDATAEAAAATVLAIQDSEETDKLALLFDALALRYNLTGNQLRDTFLGRLTGIDIADPGIATALAAPFTNGQPDNPSDLHTLRDLMRQLERKTRLFAALGLSVAAVNTLAQNRALWGIADPVALTLADVRSLDRYADLRRRNPEIEDALLATLLAYANAGGLSLEDIATLAELLDVPQKLIQSVADTLTLPATPIAAVAKLAEVAAAAGALGLDGHSLEKLVATDSAGLADACTLMLGAGQAKHPDDAKRAARLVAFAEHMTPRRRDALTAFIIGHHATFKFKDRNDLYQFFLLDTEMSGCFMTSRVICAISSLQTYINRCLMNLEQSAIPNAKVDPTWIPAEEWGWRRNYRVWEANRKVFLYPEKYIDPSLRDGKSHIFKALEDELLQQKITLETAEAAYKHYLAGFIELTRLRFAGAFAKASTPIWQILALTAFTNTGPATFMLSEQIVGTAATDSDITSQGRPKFFLSEGADDRTYFLFARTNTDPYRYYYRTYRHRGEVWGNWIKMELPIEAELISSTIHRGRLYVFWNDVKYKEINKIKGGNSESGSVNFEITTKSSSLNEDGTWTPVQRMPLGTLPSPRDDVYFRTIGRPPADEDEHDSLKNEVYATFLREVFRKPYATLTGDAEKPINLAYIWSQQQGANDVVYTTGSITASVGMFKISSPGTSFIVTNNQFGQTKVIDLKIKGLGTIVTKGMVTIANASWCIVNPAVAAPPFVVSVSASTVESNIFTTQTGLSLSRSEILDFSALPINRRDSHRSLEDSTRSYLGPEFNLGNTAATAFFVENNYETFTTSNRVLTQQPWGDATLTLPTDAGGIGTVALTTILTDELAETLYDKGLEAFLALGTQKMTDRNGQGLDFDGPFGQYYWEIYFHIPHLIANHFNANQKFEEAKWWYERIFNPTSPESPADMLPSDHNWQFREVRNVSIEKLKDILTNEAAIEAYRKDPFDPHAIARLRRSAYMKAVVMAYVDNLIDWADSLFARDTRESITEAAILYAFARDVLGDRPVQVGECKTADPLNYQIIAGTMRKGSEFLVLLEHLTINKRNRHEFAVKPLRAAKRLEAVLRASGVTTQVTRLDDVRIKAEAAVLSDRIVETRQRLADDEDTQVHLDNGVVISAKEAVATDRLSFDTKYGMPITRIVDADRPVTSYRDAVWAKGTAVDTIARALDVSRNRLNEHLTVKPNKRLPGVDVTRQAVAAFCVPHNADLLDYWDRIDKQLFKIRTCQNIDGVRRTLALTPPPIDPMMLVRARAAGLSLEDIVALVAGAGEPPPYRFNAVLQIAKQAAQMVQGFGQSLLSALEKKDLEELKLLQLTHERNLQALTKTMKERQVREARQLRTATEAMLTRAEIRLEHYAALIEEGLTGWEIVEQVATHTASGFKIAESKVHLQAGLVYLLGQVGSAFAMTYGGRELGTSLTAFAAWTSASAAVASQIANSAGLEARSQRREEDWRHQRDTVRKDVEELKARVAAAEIRLALAAKELEIQERAMEQTAEIEDFQKGKFTGLGLYNHLAVTLNRVYRRAYNIAHDLAKMAELSYQFETDSTEIFVAGDNWDPTRAGLMAGEHLSVQLAAMESGHLRANTRRPEIRQSFSLAMLDGGELLRLRQTGTCTIRIPEIAFEILYPGQYRRTIKGVRVSIPAVIGPFTNVSARLTLLESEIEADDQQPLVERLPGKNSAISLSGAVNDSGTFEFAYRDERYLPFEGAGAISEWRLELPGAIRSFDYDTITDVLIQLDYTALDGDRAAAEGQLAARINDHAASHGMFRLISLRHEMPEAWHRLTAAAPAQPQAVDFEVLDAHFPHLFRGRNVQFHATPTRIYLQPKPGASIAPPALSVNGAAVAWATAEDVARPGASGETDKMKGGTIALAGAARRTWRVDGGAGALNGLAVDDVLILLRYTVALS